MSLVLTSTILAALLLTFVARSVLAQDDQQCRDYLSDMPFLPGSSCQDIYNKNQEVVLNQDITGFLMVLLEFIAIWLSLRVAVN